MLRCEKESISIGLPSKILRGDNKRLHRCANALSEDVEGIFFQGEDEEDEAEAPLPKSLNIHSLALASLQCTQKVVRKTTTID